MTNEQLKAFVAVADYGSFRSAANNLHKTQPSISNAIKALEVNFNFVLFNRSHYRPILTSEGKTFYRKAKQLLKQASELEMLGYDLAQAEIPQLAISLSAMCAFPAILNRIKNFNAKHPKMRLQLNTEHLSGVLEQLQLEKSDFAIGPLIGVDNQYDFIKISDIKMTTVISPEAKAVISHPNTEIFTHQQLRELPHILISDTGSIATSDHINVIVGGKPWYVNDYQMKKALLVSAMGWARIPEHIIENQLKDGSLEKLVVENFNYENTVPMYLIKLKHQPLSTLAKNFWDHMTTLSAKGFNA